MNKFECDKCKQIFTSKFSLDRHIEKKISCTTVTKYQCKICNKYFKRNETLKEHTLNKNCKINIILQNTNNSTTINNKPIILDSKNDIYYILNLEVSNEEKFNLIKIINDEINYDKMLEIINYKIPLETKISLLLKFKKEVIKEDDDSEDIIQSNTNNNESDDKKVNYIYLIQERENYEANKNIYKFGKTSQYANNKIKRLTQYKKGSKIIITVECGQNITEIESKIRDRFKTEFLSHSDGHEHFEGDCIKMKKIINSIVDNN
jgi:L-fucose mutarotase/ribose pyranase (RbsD/FucU family)